MWITHRAGSRCPVVQPAAPVASPCGNRSTHSSYRPGPAAAWIAPSTPPPPRIRRFAAFTIASTRCSVMSPSTTERSTVIPSRGQHLQDRPLQRGLALLRRTVLAPDRGPDRRAALVEVDHPRVDVRRLRDRRRVAEVVRHLHHGLADGALAGALGGPGLFPRRG